jgi:ribosomal protein L37E
MTSLRKARARAFHAQQGFCCYCGYPMAESADELDSFATHYRLNKRTASQLLATAEHLRARCDGGTDSDTNIAAAHAYCNRLRHRRKNPPRPEQYRNLVQRRCTKGGWHAPRILCMPKRLPPLGL